MSAVTKEYFPSLLHLISLGVVGAATVGVFFGVGFMWLTDPQPAAPPADEVRPAQALEFPEVPPPANNDRAQGRSMEPAADNVAAIPTPNTLPPSDAAATAAPPDRAAFAMMPTAVGATLIPPTKITHIKRVRVVRYQRQIIGRRWAALWRLDARAGPNPGGGFHGPSNVNIGYINPR